MTSSITPVMDSLFFCLRSFLLDHVPVTSCRQAQLNNTAMPKGNFIIMTPLGTSGLSTDLTTYQYDPDSGISQETHTRVTEWRCQLDFYGTSSQENADIIATITRSEYACDWFRDFAHNSSGNGVVISPIACTDPKQTSMINGEDQWQDRWTCEFHAQIPINVLVPQSFMTNASVNAKSVDAVIPPENA